MYPVTFTLERPNRMSPSSGRRPGVRERAGHARLADAPLSYDRGASSKDLR